MTQDTISDFEQKFRHFQSVHQNGRFSEAENGYQEILKEKPDWGAVLTALGNLYLDQNLSKKAIPVFEKAAGLNPPDLSACYNLGRLRQLDNDPQGAIQIYRVMLDHQPEIGLVWNNIGVAYRETGKLSEAFSSFKKAVKFAPQLALAWNNLGVAQDEQHQTENAISAYRKAIEIEPNYLSPHLNLGICLQKLNQFKDAEKHYTMVIQLQPDHEIATFMLQSIRGDAPPDAAPVEHVRNIFDQCADQFETTLVDKLAYKIPELLFNLVQPVLHQDMRILDLGCGTGLGAQLYKPFASHLTGVDLSEKMVRKADEKGLYDHLAVFDLLQTWTFPDQFDLIYSSDVFVYFGNLEPIFTSCALYLNKGGKIAFSVEQLKDHSKSYHLFPSGRYAHSQQYIEDCLNRHGFKLTLVNQADIRNQSGQPVQGLLILAEKE